MAVSYMDFTAPTVQFAYDLNQNVIFKKDPRNYITALTINQLNTLGNVSLLDIYLSKDNLVEPHYHQNASELVYCVAGAAVISIINPFTNKLLHFPIKPGQVANVPQGWWHYDAATEDNTHLLAIFDAPIPDVIYGSDILRLTPPEVLAYSYCLDQEAVKETLAPLKETVVISPPKDCQTSKVQGTSTAATPTIKYGQIQGGQGAAAPGAYGPGSMAPGTYGSVGSYGYAGIRDSGARQPEYPAPSAQPTYQSYAHPYAHMSPHHPSCQQYGPRPQF
ncbi:cupin domain-containing protein [Paenibacillus daejeonensis]|uniref:cupin domain-containing protein n=1 Tax=Paenibacillus daejeonensis TaxID=135193 RepID=UPI00036DC1C9|nr:cupin domain-containing protein [Paenibacillus daejeonensis]